MINPEHYTYRVIWSAEDAEFVAFVRNSRVCPWLAEGQQDALNGIVDLVRSVIVDMAEEGEGIPEPISHRHYSGRFQVRIPPETASLLAMQAAEENVSLNRYVSAKLAG